MARRALRGPAPAGRGAAAGGATERLEDLERGAYLIARPVPIAKRIVRASLSWDNVEVGQGFDALEYAK